MVISTKLVCGVHLKLKADMFRLESVKLSLAFAARHKRKIHSFYLTRMHTKCYLSKCVIQSLLKTHYLFTFCTDISYQEKK